MPIEDDSYYRCLCNRIHVHQGAFYIAIVGSVLESMGVVGHLIANDIFMAVVSILSLLCYISVFYAYKSEKPQFYLPHIVFNTIFIIINVIISLIVVIGIVVILVGGKQKKELNGKEVAGVTAFTIFFSLIMFLLYLIQIYFVRVVYRARHYMINVMQQSQVPHFTQTVIPSVNNIL